MGSALIDMYGKCRDLISARRVFDSMPNKDARISLLGQALEVL